MSKYPLLPNGLTSMQDAFVEELLYLRNRQRIRNVEEALNCYGKRANSDDRMTLVNAWRRTHPNSKASPQTQWVEASREFAKPKVRLRYEERLREIQAQNDAEDEAMLAQIKQVLKDIIGSHPGLFYIYDPVTEKQRLRQQGELSEAAWNCVSQVGKNNYRYVDKLTAIRLFMELMGWGKSVVDVNSSPNWSGFVITGNDGQPS